MMKSKLLITRLMRYLTPVIVLIIVSFIACSKDTKSPSGPDLQPEQVTMSVTPSSAPPGTFVQISGYTIKNSDSIKTELYIGEEYVPYSVNDDSTLTAIIPLFLDSSGWSSPPSGVQDIEVRKNGELAGVATAAITVTKLPEAPGTALKVQESFVSIQQSYKNLFALMPVNDSAEIALQDALLAAFDALISGGDSSLTAILDGSSSLWGGQTPSTELLDAILASTGAASYFETYANGLAGAGDSAKSALGKMQASGLLCRTGGEDIDLACKMQIYVVLNNFTQDVVHPTAQTWASTIGLGSSLGAIVGKGVPYVQIVSAILVVMDFMMQNVAPAMLPSHITSFDLTLDSDTIAVGDYTSSEITISAGNTPVPISLNSVINVAMALIPMLPSESAEGIRAVLIRAFQFTLDQYRGKLLDYESQHPGTFTDPTVASVPAMTWGPVVVNSADLVELFSHTQDIVEGDESMMEWHGLKNGEGRIEVRTRGAGDRSKVLNDYGLCLGCFYTGGAFGNNSEATETKSVWVGDRGKIHVMIDGLPEGTDASVTMNGPNGMIPVPQNRLFEDMKIGEYSIIATEMRATDTDNEVYAPASLQWDFVLKPGDSVVVTVAYNRKYGQLYLGINGLPEGGSGDVDLLDPSSSLIGNYTTSSVVKDLAPGNYTIIANQVTYNNNQYDAAPESQAITIAAGDDSVASITYSKVLQFIDVRSLNSGWISSASVSSCQMRDTVGPVIGPIIINNCDPTRGYLTSYLPFYGKASVTCAFGMASAEIRILGDSANINKVRITKNLLASSAGYTYPSRANAYGSRGYFIDLYNSKMDTLKVTLKWRVEGYGTSGTPSNNGWSMGTFKYDWYNNDCSLRNNIHLISSSGSASWSFSGRVVDTLTEAYSMIMIANDLLCEIGGGNNASANAEISIEVQKLNK